MEAIQEIKTYCAYCGNETAPINLCCCGGRCILKEDQDKLMLRQIEFIVSKLNEHQAEKFKEDGYTNFAFFKEDGSLTPEYTIKYLVKKKWIYINFGSSGAFMVNKEDGNIYNIDGYGVPNLAKLRGNVLNLNIDTKKLFSERWVYLR